MQARAWPVPCVREHLRVRRNVLATRQTHTVATVTGCPSGTTSSSGNITPSIAACPLVYLSGRITQPWHERQRACVGARACSSPYASARALTHSHRLFHARILPPHRCASVARGRIHARYFTYAHATRHREAYSSISRHLLWRCSHDGHDARVIDPRLKTPAISWLNFVLVSLEWFFTLVRIYLVTFTT